MRFKEQSLETEEIAGGALARAFVVIVAVVVVVDLRSNERSLRSSFEDLLVGNDEL